VSGHAQRGHCELSPSSASRWMACPGSVRMSRGIPRRSSVHADEGTLAHELAERCLRDGSDPAQFLGSRIDGFDVDQDFVDALEVYVEYVRGLVDESWQAEFEVQISLEAINPPAPMRGTCDAMVRVGRTLHVVDLKFGAGVPVEAEGNKQLRYYALGAYLVSADGLFPIDQIAITIVQPRARHADGPIRTQVLTPLELIDSGLDLLEAAEAALQPDAPLVPGSQCRWCPAHATCPAARDSALAVAQQEFLEPPAAPPAPASFSDEQIGALLYRFDEVEAWMKAVRDHAFARLTAGVTVPGWKLVEKRATRKWVDEDAVRSWAKAKKLKASAITTTELLSPAAMEKALGKKFIPADLIVKQSSGLILAEEYDPRPAVNSLAAADEFSVVTD
jgi:hypothetical protein